MKIYYCSLKIYIIYVTSLMLFELWCCSSQFIVLNRHYFVDGDEDAHTDCVNACGIFQLQNAEHKQRI